MAVAARYVLSMIRAIYLTLAQMASRPFRQVFWWSALLSLVTAIAMTMLVSWLLFSTDMVGSLPWVGSAAETFADWLGVFAAILLTIILLPAFLGVYASLFVEKICRAVEQRYYPELPAAREQSIGEALWTGIVFGVVFIVANLIVLPLYLVPGLNFIIYWLLNGILFGREYYELVAFRRLPPKTAARLRRQKRTTLFVGGVVIAIVASIPVVNLLLPLLGTAFMLHIFQSLPVQVSKE